MYACMIIHEFLCTGNTIIRGAIRLRREFLEDYSATERELAELFYKELSEGRFGPEDIYPPRGRFKRVQDPIALSVVNHEIWPQIPLYGSLVVTLVPRPKTEFAQVHGFEISDINRLIDLSKDTGRIQFILGTNPQHFIGLDYLEPIFVELKPPTVPGIPLETFAPIDVLKRYAVEFDTLAGINFVRVLHEMYTEMGTPLDYIKKRLSDYRTDYIILKSMGYEAIIDKVDDALVSDAPEAISLFSIFGNLLAVPPLDPFRVIRTCDEDYIAETRRISGEFKEPSTVIHPTKLELPVEIGRFLMRKRTLFPEGYEACIDTIGKYEKEDVRNLMLALDTGAKEMNYDLLNQKNVELSTVLDNIWNDAKKISSRKSKIKYGLPIGMAVVGTIIAGPLGGLGGLLAGLGYSVTEEIIKIKEDSVTERIAKISSPSYLCAVYNFKKKYALKN